MSSLNDPELMALLESPPESVNALLAAITPGIFQKLQSAVELGRWEDGQRLQREQLELCMQLVILYEAQHLPESQRTGAPLNRECASHTSKIRFVNGPAGSENRED